MTDKMIGKTVSHYRILSKLGEGGMGVVFEAEDTTLKRTVALKFLPPELTQDRDAKERFLYEARAAAALNHPNICTVHEIGEWEERSFIAMECVEGESLKGRIRAGPFPLEDAIDIAVQIAEGLGEAHEKGIVHRDIKPGNVMLSVKGRAKVMDFGLAKSRERTQLTKTGSTVGTASYMSPEQARGEAVDRRTDIWSVGVVLYEMLTGQRPFKGDHEQAVVYSLVNEEPEHLTGVRTGVPVELERVVEKCLAKNPGERYQTAADLVADLHRIRRKVSERTSASKEAARSMLGREPTKAKIRRIAATALGGAVVLVVLVLLFDVGNLRGRLFGTAGPGGPRRIESLAILPFVNTGSDPDMEYLADEIPASIMDNLSRLPTLRVVPRSTVFRFKGRGDDPVLIGRELKVGAVLTGQANVRGDNLSIRAELVDVVNNRQLWGDRYRRKMDDILALEEEIATNISNALKLQLTGEERLQLGKRQTVSPEAHRLYLKGRYFLAKRTSEGFRKAIDYFERAVEQDPTYALAYTGLADSYDLLASWGFVSPKEVLPKTKAATLRALEIDSTLAEAHASLAAVKEYERDWKGEEEEFKRAIELNPNYAQAHHWYGYALATATGRLDDALASVRRAQELDPFSLIIGVGVGEMYYYQRDYDRAIEEFHRVLEMDPSFEPAHASLGEAYAQKGMHEQAIAELERAVARSDSAPDFVARLGYTYAIAGMPGKARRILDDMYIRAKRSWVPPSFFAMIYTGLGEKDQAFMWLDKGYEELDVYLTNSIRDPFSDPLRDDPRFSNLIRRMGLEPSLYVTTHSAGLRSGKIILAVLPFDNLSPDPGQEYFSDGMTEEMIARLGGLQPDRLGVIARTTAMRYKGTDKRVRQIGKELGADYILEGSVRKAAGKIRITASLVQVSDETQVWTDTVERRLADVFAVQSDVAEGVARALALKLMPRETARLAESRPVDPDAYEAYIRGRYHWERRTDQDMKSSLAYFQKAIDVDPGYALAYAGLADACALLGINGHIAPMEIIPRAKAAAEKAIELDSTLAGAYATLGFIQFAYERDWTRADKTLQRAGRLNPGYATTYLYRAVCLSCLGRLDEAIDNMRHAQQLDPLAFMLNVNVSRFYTWNHEYDMAIKEVQKVLDLDPDFAFAHYALGLAYRGKGMPERAIAELKRSVELAGDYPLEHFGELGYTYAATGREDEARKMLGELVDQSKRNYVAPSMIAKIYVGLGDLDRAFEWLNRAEKVRDDFVLLLKVSPEYDRLRSDPRYKKLLEKIGLE